MSEVGWYPGKILDRLTESQIEQAHKNIDYLDDKFNTLQQQKEEIEQEMRYIKERRSALLNSLW